MRRRVKVTGLGPVTPAGIGRAAFYRGINEPISRVVRSKLAAREGHSFVAAEISDFQLSDWMPSGEIPKRLPRQTQLALAGAQLAMADAGLTWDDLRYANPVIVNGSSLMDVELFYKTFVGVQEHGPKGAKPQVVFEAPPISVAGHIAQMIPGGGPTRITALQSACCSGLDAVGFGAEQIATGQAEIAICCGTEAPILYQPMVELTAAKLASDNLDAPELMSRPFDLHRPTGVIGEGAAVCILEPEESERPGYAWISGYAFGNDRGGGESGDGLFTTMRMALANAQKHPHEVDAVNAWGPGHPTIDRVEARCLWRLFGERMKKIAVTSIKGAIGNALGAAGAIQVASTALTLREGVLPPTVNWSIPDPECALNLSARGRRLLNRVMIVNAHGLSGSNATIVMEAIGG